MASSSDQPVNVAVVGLGFMGVTHLRAYLENPAARVVAVCDPYRLPVNGVLAGVAGNVKASGDLVLGTEVKAFRDLEELLALREVALVDICTPTPMHAGQAIAALQAGKHVLCEKPMARSSVAAREITLVAEKGGGLCMPAMCMRFWPGWAWLRAVVREQTYGQVRAARFRRVSALPAWSTTGTFAGAGNDSGGALFDLHIHDSDFVNFLFGRPHNVYSSGVVATDGSIHHVVTQYHFPDGPAVYAEGSWLLTQGFNMSYTLHCERATLDFDLTRGADMLVVTEANQSPRVIKCDGPDGYGAEVGYFVRCVAQGRPPEVVTARDAVTALEICEAEEQSVRSGTAVKL